MAFIGIDLHSDQFTVARVHINQEKLETITRTYNLDDKSLGEFKSSLNKTDYIAVEASSNSFWFHDQVNEYVKECLVYNVNDEKNRGNKTDKIDARKLAKKLSYYICMGGNEEDFPTVYIPEKKIRELRGLFSSYNLQKKIIVKIKNRIHSLLKEVGICIKKADMERKDFPNWVKNIHLPFEREMQITIFLTELKNTKNSQDAVKELIYKLGNDLFNQQIELLLSIKGFSAFTAICLMAEIVDIDRFSNAKKFCSYLRTAPKVKSSNNTTHIGKINKNSRKTVCTLLTQSVIHFRKDDGYLKSFYERVHVGKSAGKVRMALIRKILVCAFHMLKKDEKYSWVDDISYQKKLKEYKREISNIELKFSKKKEKKIS